MSTTTAPAATVSLPIARNDDENGAFVFQSAEPGAAELSIPRWEVLMAREKCVKLYAYSQFGKDRLLDMCREQRENILAFSSINPDTFDRLVDEASQVHDKYHSSPDRKNYPSDQELIKITNSRGILLSLIFGTSEDWTCFFDTLRQHHETLIQPDFKTGDYLDAYCNISRWCQMAYVLLKFYLHAIRNQYIVASDHFYSDTDYAKQLLPEYSVLTWSEFSDIVAANYHPYFDCHINSLSAQDREERLRKPEFMRDHGVDNTDNFWVYEFVDVMKLGFWAGRVEKTVTPWDMLVFQAHVYTRCDPVGMGVRYEHPYSALAMILSASYMLPMNMILVKDPSIADLSLQGKPVDPAAINVRSLWSNIDPQDNRRKVRAVEMTAQHFTPKESWAAVA